MNISELVRTFEVTLDSITELDTVDIIWENTGQTPPTDAIYVMPETRPVDDDRNTLNSTGEYIRHSGTFFVYIIDPRTMGTFDANILAQTIANNYRSTTIDIGHGRVHVDVPRIQRRGRTDKGYVVAVAIGYWYYASQ